MATRSETGKKVEPRPSLWWQGIAKSSVTAATDKAANNQLQAHLIREGVTGPAVVSPTQSYMMIFLRERGVTTSSPGAQTESRHPGVLCR